MAGGRDVLIAGGGIIGLSLAIELEGEGFAVSVVERDVCMRGASWAAAGMLAAEDPHNPAAMVPLAMVSRDLYPEYLARVERLSQMRVPLRTRVTLQESDDTIDDATVERLAPGLSSRNFTVLEEGSLDPRDLCAALPVAARSMGVEIIENVAVIARQSCAGGVTTRIRSGRNTVRCSAEPLRAASLMYGLKPAPFDSVNLWIPGEEGDIEARWFVDCRGLESGTEIEPRKGQMLSVAFATERLRCAVRTEHVYMVPRGNGCVVVGATVERGVNDTVVHGEALDELVAHADAILPGIAQAERLDSWAGVRPGTADDLPMIGGTGEANCYIAAGHFKNGFLLASGTARVMGELLRGERPSVPVDAFSPARFSARRE